MEVCVLDLFSTLDVDVGSCRDHVSLVCTADGVWCGDRWLESDVVLCASGDNDIPGYMVKAWLKKIEHLGLVVVAVVGVFGVGVEVVVEVVQPGAGVEGVRGEVGVVVVRGEVGVEDVRGEVGVVGVRGEVVVVHEQVRVVGVGRVGEVGLVLGTG